MGKQEPLRETARRAVLHWSVVMWLWLCTRKSRGRMSASRAACTQVWAPLVERRQNQSLWCSTTPCMVWTSWTKCEGLLRQRWKDSQCRSSITSSSTWLGSMPASYSGSTSSRRGWRKVLQQLAAEPQQSAQGGQQHNQPPQQQQAWRQRQCRSDRAAN